ncbi:hypothetical protein [Streptomyces sp. NPDC051000]|uniref:hypothetical protein n=1 Tax=Streptomyces sp. NPDC051000 TaxID=3155520 RepID=UPI0033CCC494
MWDPEAGRLSFEALQRRAAARSAATLATRTPAHFVAFDILQADDIECSRFRIGSAAGAWKSSSWPGSDGCKDVVSDDHRCGQGAGVAGGLDQRVRRRRPGGQGESRRYRLGACAWTKIRRRDTAEAIIGAITGALARPSY